MTAFIQHSGCVCRSVSLASPFAACNGNQQGSGLAGNSTSSVFLSLCHPGHDEREQEQHRGLQEEGEGQQKPREACVYTFPTSKGFWLRLIAE